MKLPGGDVLLLAGDVCVADYLRPERSDKDARRQRSRYLRFFHEECTKYARVYYVMGNHEHYRGCFHETANVLRAALDDTNVYLLDKEFVSLTDEWELFGGTLWTDFSKDDWFVKQHASTHMNDHHQVFRDEKKKVLFTPNNALAEHQECLAVLKAGLEERKNKNVLVMTHHAPHYGSITQRFRNQPTSNGCYYSDQEELMLDNPNLKCWVHGHVHDSLDYMVGDCRVVCNPRGYAGHALNAEFDATKTLQEL